VESTSRVAGALCTALRKLQHKPRGRRQRESDLSFLGSLYRELRESPHAGQNYWFQIELLKGLSVDGKDRPQTAVEFWQLLSGKHDARTERKIKGTRGLKAFWESLESANKVGLITAIVAAIGAIIVAIIGAISKAK
jgi:hypothetical protein